MTRLADRVSPSRGNNHPHARLTLRELRVRAGLSLRELEREISISRAYLSGIETGTRTPTAGELIKLADFYSVSFEQCRFVTLATFEVEP